VTVAAQGFFGQIYSGFVDPVPRHVGTREGRPSLGLQSYDRFISNQDTLPKGGFGNLIGLPLQKHAWDRGNTFFLDESFARFSAQRAFLPAIKTISRLQAGTRQLVKPARG